MRINCYFPITLRIVGVPTDDQLAAIGRALVRIVSARLAEAERLLADRHAIAAGGPVDVRGPSLSSPEAADVRPTVHTDSSAAFIGSGFIGSGFIGVDSSLPEASDPGAGARDVVFSLAATSAQPVVRVRTPSNVDGPATPATRPRVVHLDTSGSRRQADRSETLAHGGNPDEPPIRRPDPIRDALREARDTAAGIAHLLPGDFEQQRHTIDNINPLDLWDLARVQAFMQGLADSMERWERGRSHPNLSFDAAYWLGVWQERFRASVQYVLYYRGFTRDGVTTKGVRRWHLDRLVAAEKQLIQKYPPPPADAGAQARALWAVGLSQQVKTLRQAAQDYWHKDVDWVVDRFLVLTDNQVKFLTVKQNGTPTAVRGLPSIEPPVPASAALHVLEASSTPVAPAVVRFMEALQQRWGGRKVKAGDYPHHEENNPHWGAAENLGKYSFDVGIDGFVKLNSDGFYEHDETVKFFLAVDAAARATEVSWFAWYNDFEVAKEVTERLGEIHIGFSGGGTPRNATPEQEGSLHHGPSPYILHIHFNIMENRWAAVLLRWPNTAPNSPGITGD